MGNDPSSWQTDAICRGQDPAIFFLDKGSDRSKEDYKTFCNKCPVKAACLEFALLYNLSGIWGGTTDSQRGRRYSEDHIEILRDDARESGIYRKELKV